MGIGKNKKGGIQDLIFILVVLLVFSMMVLIGFKFLDELNTKFQASDVINDKGKASSQSLRDLYPKVIDNSFLFLMIGLCIVAIILAMLVAFHPVFFIFYFIFLVIIIFLGGIFSNIYQTAAQQTELVNVANQMVYMSHIMQYLPIIIGVFGFVLAIVMYRTYRNAA